MLWKFNRICLQNKETSTAARRSCMSIWSICSAQSVLGIPLFTDLPLSAKCRQLYCYQFALPVICKATINFNYRANYGTKCLELYTLFIFRSTGQRNKKQSCDSILLDPKRNVTFLLCNSLNAFLQKI